MSPAASHFNANIDRARAICALAHRLEGLTTAAVDISDLYRSAIVHGVSALDHFVHEFVRFSMLEVHSGIRPTTPAHLTFPVPISAVRVGLANPTDSAWLEKVVRESHSWLTFQDPEKIADAIRLISGVKLWEEVGKELGITAQAAKTGLKTIVDRRNKIAHEADIDPTNPGQRWPIDQLLVNDALDYLEKVGQAIEKVAV